jgi:glycosyltransferase involved in cell wall biosynthesis
VDAVVYFVREIWPLAKSKLPSGAKFLVIGPDAPAALSSLVSEDVVLTGHLPSLDEVMDSCRLSVAPLRYGAGIKGKLVKSLADGLPAVASSIAVEGMGLTHGKEVLVSDDPADFAAEVVRLYSDPDLWQSIQAAGYNFIKERYSWARGLELCRQILDTANETWITNQSLI